MRFENYMKGVRVVFKLENMLDIQAVNSVVNQLQSLVLKLGNNWDEFEIRHYSRRFYSIVEIESFLMERLKQNETLEGNV